MSRSYVTLFRLDYGEASWTADSFANRLSVLRNVEKRTLFVHGTFVDTPTWIA